MFENQRKTKKMFEKLKKIFEKIFWSYIEKKNDYSKIPNVAFRDKKSKKCVINYEKAIFTKNLDIYPLYNLIVISPWTFFLFWSIIFWSIILSLENQKPL